MRIPKSRAGKSEQGGIDEAYLDISSRVKDFDEAKEYAKRIMEEVLEKKKADLLDWCWSKQASCQDRL